MSNGGAADTTAAIELAMFPLGTVLFPGVTLPLHVFEPRYQALTRSCLDGDGHLGITLIERGSEVGGGDVRFAVGTRARIAQAVALDDDRWFLVLVGVDRIRVDRWLPELPFPRAVVEVLTDEPPGDGAAGLRDEVERLLRQAMALLAELGGTDTPLGGPLGPTGPPATVSLAAEPDVAAWQAAAVAPFGPADAQRVLEAESADERLRLLVELLADEVAVLAHRAAGR
ncbi:MAG: LON peptidase substrate-binding domain-containing protein [Actinomycetota bacterium]|nr:LON peptidase substrate-binding domain-containing protein [Actinomycetota bacterium]